MMCRPVSLLLMVVAVWGGAAGTGISHQYPRSARQAVPYLAHLLESRSSPLQPVVGLLPLSVDMQRERLVARFPGAPIPPNPGSHKMVLVFQRRRALPHQYITLCVHDHCSVTELQPSPIPNQYVAEVPMLAPGPHVELEVRGRNAHGLGVISLVVLEPRPPSPAPPRQHRSTPLGRANESPVCQLRDWTVTITELHWNDVIWPTEFQANYCGGTCPLEKEMYSNHALFRQVYNDYNGGTIPGPCCVPVAVKPLDVLVFVGHVITKDQYRDAMAEACACL